MSTSSTTRGLSRLARAAALLLIAAAAPALGGEPLTPVQEPPSPRFDRLYTYEEIVGFLEGYAAAYPDWTHLESVGQSAEGRDLWLLTITSPEGDELRKPAMYIDGNTHANEVQGSEACLYLIDFVLKNYGKLPRVDDVLDRAVLYLLPVVNPDGRTRWFVEPSTPHFPRTVAVPIDDDRDGLADEDGYDDLNGDGVITQMRLKVPLGEGTHKLDPDEPRVLKRVSGDERGDYKLLGYEGFDNDGDGAINEDSIGYVDPNRTWGYDFQPRYVQRGAPDYPLQIPESRRIAEWFLEHPNLAAGQSFHNAGRMILRGPGSKSVPPYPRADVKVYDLIADEGERLLPGYRAMVIWKDLYTAHASTVDHLYGIHGAISFTNELYSAPTDLNDDGQTTDEERMTFNDLLTLGRQFVPWTTVEHPQYGAVEVGGFRHDVGRVPETWMLEVESHRNSAFVLFHAWNLPKLVIEQPEVRRLEGDLWRVEVPVSNERAIPSMSAMASNNRLHRPDLVTIEGAKVIASGQVENPWLDEVDLQRHRPERLEVDGIPGFSRKRLMFLVQGAGELTVVYDSLKAGEFRRSFRLE